MPNNGRARPRRHDDEQSVWSRDATTRRNLSADMGRDGETEHQHGPPPCVRVRARKSKLETREPMEEEAARKEELRAMLVLRWLRLGEEAGTGAPETWRGGRRGPGACGDDGRTEEMSPVRWVDGIH